MLSFLSPSRRVPWSVKTGLHFGNYRSKLVGFETQQNIFYVKKALVKSDNRHCVNTT
jgi:hypothetical protein